MLSGALGRAAFARNIRATGIRQVSTDIWSPGQPRTVFSGIQPTGTPHLGNFLGALQNWVKIQREADPADTLIFSIVGWHSLTLPQNPQTLLVARREMLAALLAIGLDPKRCIMFHQDENPHHTDLAWLLSCITPLGKLRRMTTWKARLAASRNANDESEIDDTLLNAGLFTYPVLQAADILAYKATHVPIGEDQKQHLELARDIAMAFTHTFKPLFPNPEPILTPTCRVLSLRDPSSKMSKSSPDVSSRILLTDTDAEIKQKIRGAVTDTFSSITYDRVDRPGTANLLTILAACTGEELADVVKRFENKRHSDLKAEVTDAVCAFMSKPRAEFERLRGETAYLTEVAREGVAKAMDISGSTMLEVKRTIGLADPDP